MARGAIHRYVAFHKPYGVLAQPFATDGRPAVGNYVDAGAGAQSLEPAGRLDLDSEGLLLLTDDGRLSHLLTHPAYYLPKTYLVQVEGRPDETALDALRRGVNVKGERTAPAEVELLPDAPDLPPRPVPVVEPPGIPTTWLRIVLHEGRKRQIRHMTAAVGHPALRLVRVAIGPLALGDLRPGQWRRLTEREVALLWRAVGAP